MLKIVISGYYGFDNLGDEAVLAAFIKGLREMKKECEITVLSHNPEITSTRYNVKAVGRNNILEVIRVLRDSDLFLSGGGSLLQDITGKKSIPYYLGQVFLAKMLNKKAVFYAQGIGPVRNVFYKKMIAWTANQCDLITLRDQGSQKLLSDFGVRDTLLEVYTDPAFILQPEAVKDRFNTSKKLVGVSVRSWRDNDYLPAFVSGIEYLASVLSAEILIIPFHYTQDQEISKRLAEELNCEKQVLNNQFTPQEMLNLFSALDFCVGIRLHSLIFAAVCSIPFVGISYDPKVEIFLQELGVDSRLEINNLSAGMFREEIDRVWCDREIFIQKNNRKTKKYRELALDNISDILKLI